MPVILEATIREQSNTGHKYLDAVNDLGTDRDLVQHFARRGRRRVIDFAPYPKRDVRIAAEDQIRHHEFAKFVEPETPYRIAVRDFREPACIQIVINAEFREGKFC